MPRLNTNEFLRRLPKLQTGLGVQPTSESRLVETEDFGKNPGALRMLSFVPHDLPHDAALVVVLHGCTQTAAAYDSGSGWSALAEQRGFAVLYPEQQRSNNPNLCFNWFNSEDICRGSGEARSIRMMIDAMIRKHGIDPHRIFVTGLSAGGAMASVMLATYPDVFAAGAIIAGLPFGIADNLREALSGMSGAPPHSADALGTKVRAASPHQGKWPRISVWHGDADRIVSPSNAGEIVKQWLDVHGLRSSAPVTDDVDGHVHEQWRDVEGSTLVESYTVRAMAHGTPLAIDGEQDAVGAAGPYMLDVGISSTLRIAEFFGLADTVRERAAKPSHDGETVQILQPLPKKSRQSPKQPLDVSEIINRALSAAGLLK